MILINKRPDRAQKNNAALISRWGCANQPYLFELWRQDVTVISCHDGVAGLIVVKAEVNSANMAIAGGLSVGDEIYVASGTITSEGTHQFYNTTGTIVSIAVNPTYVLFYTTIPTEQATTDGGYMNVVGRKNYYLSVILNVFNPIKNITETFVQKLTPDSYGRMRLDASGFLSKAISRVNRFDYSVLNLKSTGAYGSFYFSHQERYLGFTGMVVNDPITYNFADAVKQVSQDYGQNLCDHVLFPSSFTPAAKFLTRFDSPTYFVGYPFDLSFIYSGELTFMQILCKEDEFNANGSALSSISRQIDTGQRNAVNRLTLSGTGYTAQTSQLDVFLRANSFVQESYFESGYIEDLYFENDPPSPPALTPYDLTERKRIRISTPCAKNPVYLCWKNQLGGFDYWLFEMNQIRSGGAKHEGDFVNDSDDVADQIVRIQKINVSSGEKISCGANVSINDLLGIKGLEKSPNVYLLTSLSPITWIQMVVVPKGFTYQTKGTNVDVLIELEYPQEYTLANG